jgi:hypothetical protein
VQWTNVPYFGVPGSSNNFAIILDSTTSSITIDGLSNFAPVGGGGTGMFLGISPGSPLASDPGPINFLVGGPNPGPAGLGMLYAFGPTGTLAPGAMGLILTPNGSNNYDWAAY